MVIYHMGESYVNIKEIEFLYKANGVVTDGYETKKEVLFGFIPFGWTHVPKRSTRFDIHLCLKSGKTQTLSFRTGKDRDLSYGKLIAKMEAANVTGT